MNFLPSGSEQGTPGQAVPPATALVGGADPTGKLRSMATDSAGIVQVNLTNAAPVPVSMASPVTQLTLGAKATANSLPVCLPTDQIPLSTISAMMSAASNGTAFGATSGVVPITLSTTYILGLANPAGSGKSLLVQRITVGSAVVAGILVQAVSGGTWGGTKGTPANRLVFSSTASVASAYTGTVTVSGGTAFNVGYLFANGCSVSEDINGDLIIPPGCGLIFSAAAEVLSLTGLDALATCRLTWRES